VRKTAVIDRFEGDVAVLVVDGAEQPVRRDELPKGAREGDVIDLATRRVDADATRKLKEEVARTRLQAFAGKKVKGDFEL
jgi:hypothetical protein